MTAQLDIVELGVRGFRNLTQVEIEPGPRFNIISGNNGQGKTSLLEAIYFVCTSKSFRTEKLPELRQFAGPFAVVDADIRDAGLVRRQRAVLNDTGRELLIDDKTPARLADYAIKSPIVVFQPGDLQLIAGSASGRRKLLDRVALFLNPASLDHRQRFQRAQRERQRLLETRGAGASELASYERVMARHGTQLEQLRLLAAERLTHAAAYAFEQLADSRLRAKLSFVPGGPYEEEELTRQLALSRNEDQRRRATRLGPHKDELEVALDHKLARRHASQGQQRVLALALKIAELECLRQARGVFPLLLLDDVSSELDHARTQAVYDFLGTNQCQIFLTTTRPELFNPKGGNASERRDFRLEQGAVQP
jgi:DNA replication and repair protein RecF